MSNDLAFRLAAARRRLASKMPYLTQAIARVEPVAVPDSEQAVQPGWRLNVGESDSVNQLAWSMAGAALVQVLDMPRRGESRQPEVWAAAVSVALNDILMPALANDFGPVAHRLSAQLLGLDPGTAEHYYSQFMAGTKHAKATMLNGVAGPGLTTPQQPEQPSAGDDPAKAMTHMALDARLKAGARKSLSEAKLPGRRPGELEQLALDLLKSPADVGIRDVLATWYTNQVLSMKPGSSVRSYRRPSRRQSVMPADIVLPSRWSPRPKVGVIVDTSGSMSDDDIARALGHVQAVIEGARARLLLVDTEVHVDQDVDTASEVLVAAGRGSGRGGTDMRVGIELLEQDPDISGVICLTDGWTPWPNTLALPLCVVLIGDMGEDSAWRRNVPSGAVTLRG